MINKQSVIKELTNLLDSGKKPSPPKRGKCNIIMLVGLQGNGKTTTCCKLAYYYKKRNWKVGVVCADTFRAGAFDQIAQNCSKIKIPYYGKRDESDPAIIALNGVNRFKKQKFEIIIVDTSGRHKQEQSLFEEMEAISICIKPNHTIFVLDSTMGQMAELQASAFKDKVNIGSVIVTKLDGHAKGGGALSAVAKTKAPITFIGVGEHMDDLQKFNTKSFIQRILGRGDIDGFMDKIKEMGLNDESHTIKKLQKGKFTLNMLKQQLQNIIKIGSFEQMTSMIPGLNQLMKQQNIDNERQKELYKSLLLLMDSMTSEELQSNDISIIENSRSRQDRICRGSGVDKKFIIELIRIYKQFSITFKKTLSGKKNSILNKYKQNPQQFMNQIGGQGLINFMQTFQNGRNRMGNMQRRRIPKR